MIHYRNRYIYMPMPINNQSNFITLTTTNNRKIKINLNLVINCEECFNDSGAFTCTHIQFFNYSYNVKETIEEIDNTINNENPINN